MEAVNTGNLKDIHQSSCHIQSFYLILKMCSFESKSYPTRQLEKLNNYLALGSSYLGIHFAGKYLSVEFRIQ